MALVLVRLAQTGEDDCMLSRRALLVRSPSAVFCLSLLGCFGAPRHPRITLVSSGFGDEGGESSFVIDAEGRFRWESKGDAGNGVMVTKRCSGSLEHGEVASLFEAFERAPLVSGEVVYEEGRRGRSVLTLEGKSGQPRSPADRTTFDRLAGLVQDASESARARAECEEKRE
jgi:hypothetical protein